MVRELNCFRESATPLSQASGAQHSPIFGVLFHLCLHPLTQNDHVRKGNTFEEGACFLGSTTPPIPKRRSFNDPPIASFNAELSRSARQQGEGLVLGGQPRLLPKRAWSPADSNVGVLSYMYLCVHGLTKSDQIRRATNTYRVGCLTN